MKGRSIALLGTLMTAWTASAQTSQTKTLLVGNPIEASTLPGQPSCEGTDQIQYRVTFSVKRVLIGKAPAKKPTAIVCSHQRAGIFDAAAYLLIGTTNDNELRFDATKASFIACPGDGQLPELAHYKLQATGALSAPSENGGSDCVVF